MCRRAGPALSVVTLIARGRLYRHVSKKKIEEYKSRGLALRKDVLLLSLDDNLGFTLLENIRDLDPAISTLDLRNCSLTGESSF